MAGRGEAGPMLGYYIPVCGAVWRCLLACRHTHCPLSFSLFLSSSSLFLLLLLLLLLILPLSFPRSRAPVRERSHASTQLRTPSLSLSLSRVDPRSHYRYIRAQVTRARIQLPACTYASEHVSGATRARPRARVLSRSYVRARV